MGRSLFLQGGERSLILELVEFSAGEAETKRIVLHAMSCDTHLVFH